MYHSKMSGFCTDPFRRTVPGAFFHLPPHFLGTGPFTLIDVKVVDPAAPSYCSRLTGREALGRHGELERAGPLDYFGPGRSI